MSPYFFHSVFIKSKQHTRSRFSPLQPIPEISRRVKALNQERAASGLPAVLLHTDAAQALGKRRVDVEDLGVDFLTIVGHKVRTQRPASLLGKRGSMTWAPEGPLRAGLWDAVTATPAQRSLQKGQRQLACHLTSAVAGIMGHPTHRGRRGQLGKAVGGLRGLR